MERYFKDQRINFTAAKNIEHEITIHIGGDLLPYHLFNKKTCAHLRDDIGEYFFDADIVAANLETPVDLSKKPSLCPEVMFHNLHFNADNEIFSLFSHKKKSAYDLLFTANNHAFDMGIS